VIGSAGVVAAEQARFIVERHEAWLHWLDEGGERPSGFDVLDDDRAARIHLNTALEHAGVSIDLPADASRTATLFALLHRIGMRSRPMIEAVVVAARLPVIIAEALAVPPGSFKEYPMDLPPYRYQGQS
jgi:hypothetical protein